MLVLSGKLAREFVSLVLAVLTADLKDIKLAFQVKKDKAAYLVK